MFWYNLISKPSFHIEEKTVDNVFTIVSKIVDIWQKWTINIAFLDDDSIQKLNKKYRNIDQNTDVLSFHYYDDFSNLTDEDIAGEVMLSESKIKTQAIEYWLWEENEFYKLLIHSLLHVLGYDHEVDKDYEIMQELENKIWKEVFEK